MISYVNVYFENIVMILFNLFWNLVLCTEQIFFQKILHSKNYIFCTISAKGKYLRMSTLIQVSVLLDAMNFNTGIRVESFSWKRYREAICLRLFQVYHIILFTISKSMGIKFELVKNIFFYSYLDLYISKKFSNE